MCNDPVQTQYICILPTKSKWCQQTCIMTCNNSNSKMHTLLLNMEFPTKKCEKMNMSMLNLSLKSSLRLIPNYFSKLNIYLGTNPFIKHQEFPKYSSKNFACYQQSLLCKHKTKEHFTSPFNNIFMFRWFYFLNTILVCMSWI